MEGRKEGKEGGREEIKLSRQKNKKSVFTDDIILYVGNTNTQEEKNAKKNAQVYYSGIV